MNINPLTSIDFYKSDHRRQYPDGTTEVYSNFTPRSSKLANVFRDTYDNKIVFFGLQYFIRDFLIETWNEGFFNRKKIDVLIEYKRRMDNSLGKDAIDISHIEALHNLGYLPLKIKALPEGARVPIGVPVLTVVNTHPCFFWLTNYIESILSCYLWKPITSATTAYEYKRLLTKYASKTGVPLDIVDFQCHDFSFRGMSGPIDAAISGAGHLTSFCGTDTVLAIDFVEKYYDADVERQKIGFSVPATEHSVMSMGKQSSEIETFRRLINELYPKGIVSIVSDTWDFWKVITEYLPELKREIMSRDGKVVIRPDSGDPVKIICGSLDSNDKNYPSHLGAVECLWNVFGGTTNDKGYKVLDEHIGLIYGDSITLERAKEIMERLEAKGFASSNIIFGVGSYTYQYVTRDNFGFAMKATSGVVKGERRNIFKNPVTDDGSKKSAKGLLRVEKENGQYVLHDQQTKEEEERGELKTVFYNGNLLFLDSFVEIKNRVKDDE